MIFLDVILQAQIVIEGFITMLTLERLLSCVQTHMRFQVARLAEATLADGTFKGLRSRVHDIMPLKRVPALEFKVTDVAF